MTASIRNRPLPAPPLRYPLAALLAGMILGVFARGPNTLPGDITVSQWVQRLDGRAFGQFADVGNAFGTSAFAFGVLVVCVVVLGLQRAWPEVTLLIAIGALRGVAVVLKGLVDSPRPAAPVIELIGGFDGYGYPSGHAMTATTAAGGLAFLIAHHLVRPGLRWLVWTIAVIAVLTTIYARVWVGAHWFSDTVGGVVFGVAILMFGAVISRRVTIAAQ